MRRRYYRRWRSYRPRFFKRYRRSYRSGYRSGGGMIRISYKLKTLLAGAVLFFIAMLFLPGFSAWWTKTWVRLGLPTPK